MSAAPEAETEEGTEPAAPKSRLSRRTLVIAAVAALLPLIGVAVFFMMRSGSGEEAHAEAPISETFVDVPPMIVNIRGAGGQPIMLKVHVMLVPRKAEDAPAVTARMPLVIDAFQPFLRELRPDDLAGSAAIFRIKEELLRRAQGAAGPDQVGEVLVQELIQQ